jgi:hypothetical protein
MTPLDVAEHVLAAVESLGGEAQRVDIIDRALDIGGWTAEERAVVSWYTKAARYYHLRTLADYAVTTCRARGLLEPEGTPGRWRLVAPRGEVELHPYGRVFTAAVGLGEEPVDDDWRADEYASEHGHVWYRVPSRQLSRGDHLFALGAGRNGAVLGLFEVQSAGDLRRPQNPWEPERWPYAVAVRALASVPPSEAVSVDGISAPRQTAHRKDDPGDQAALYAAVRGYAVAADATPGGCSGGASLAQRARAERRPRPFDPIRRPRPANAADGDLDLDEIQTRQEKARQDHHDLLSRLHAALVRAGWTELEEIPVAIDLSALSPDGQRRVIFEAKTILASNETDQCRKALAQLLEYRQEYGRPDDVLCIAVNAALSARRAELLERLGIAAVLSTLTAEDLSSLSRPG